ncbi:hypothetical protein FXW78_25635 [Rhodococcus opacus]|nr:hypothetical protein [Rhodococcus opacus]
MTGTPAPRRRMPAGLGRTRALRLRCVRVAVSSAAVLDTLGRRAEVRFAFGVPVGAGRGGSCRESLSCIRTARSSSAPSDPAGDWICAFTCFDNSVLPWFGLPRSLPNR